MVVFSVMTIKNLLNENKIEDVKEYVQKYFFKTTDSYFFKNVQTGKYDNFKQKDLRQYIPKDLTNQDYIEENNLKSNRQTKFNLFDYMVSSEFCDCSNNVQYGIFPDTDDDIVSITRNIKGKALTQKYLNMVKPLPFDLSECKDIKEKDFLEEIEVIDNHIKEVLCGGNIAMFEYVRLFFAFSIAGVKVRKAIFMLSEERTGKGIYLNFLDRVLGERMLKTSSTETITKYTKPLEGVVLVNIDELPELRGNLLIQDKLKGLITEDKFDCRDMYSVGYTQTNTFNIIITTNIEGSINLSQSNKERYICPDVSDHRKGDFKYFQSVIKAMNCKGVIPAYFNHMRKLYEENKDFNFDIMPNSRTRDEKIISALPPLYKYIKDEFIFNNADMDIECKQLLDEYNTNAKFKMTLHRLHKDLKKIGIIKTTVSVNGSTKRKFIVPVETLRKIFISKRWYDPEIEDDEAPEEEVSVDDMDYIKVLYAKHPEKFKEFMSILEGKKPKPITVESKKSKPKKIKLSENKKIFKKEKEVKAKAKKEKTEKEIKEYKKKATKASKNGKLITKENDNLGIF